MGVKSEGGFAPEGVACVAKKIQYVGVCDESRLSAEGDGVDCSSPGGVRHCPEDVLNLCPIADDRAEVRVSGSSLCPRVHLLSVLLIYKSDGDELGDCEEPGVVVIDDRVVCSSENETLEVDASGSASYVRFGVLARMHGEKEGSNDYVRNDCGSGVTDSWMVRRLKELSK
jgi:hypothetical protein